MSFKRVATNGESVPHTCANPLANAHNCRLPNAHNTLDPTGNAMLQQVKAPFFTATTISVVPPQAQSLALLSWRPTLSMLPTSIKSTHRVLSRSTSPCRTLGNSHTKIQIAQALLAIRPCMLARSTALSTRLGVSPRSSVHLTGSSSCELNTRTKLIQTRIKHHNLSWLNLVNRIYFRLDLDYVCNKLPGIGGVMWDLGIAVRGMPPSTFSSNGDQGHDPINQTLKYAPPEIVSIKGSNGADCGTACSGSAGDVLSISGYNFPPDAATAAAWEQHFHAPEGSALKIMMGDVPCAMSNFTDDKSATCTIPASNGINKAIGISVGGQPLGPSSAGKYNFNFNAPEVDAVKGPDGTANGPSYGGITITITGKNFGSKGNPLEVIFTNGDSNLTCPVTTFTDTTIQCLQPKSNSSKAVDFSVSVYAGQQWTTNEHIGSFHTAACTDHCSSTIPGRMSCLEDGACVCAGNYELTVGKDLAAVCNCPTSSPCKGGSTFKKETCGCACRAAPQQWEPAPAPPPDGPEGKMAPPATCNACSVPCSGALQHSAPSKDGLDCECHFNGLHVIWMVALIVAGVAGGFYGYQRHVASQNNDAIYQQFLPDGGAKPEPDRDSTDRESSTGKMTFM